MFERNVILSIFIFKWTDFVPLHLGTMVYCIASLLGNTMGNTVRICRITTKKNETKK